MPASRSLLEAATAGAAAGGTLKTRGQRGLGEVRGSTVRSEDSGDQMRPDRGQTRPVSGHQGRGQISHRSAGVR